jgi:hypothetical protein
MLKTALRTVVRPNGDQMCTLYFVDEDGPEELAHWTPITNVQENHIQYFKEFITLGPYGITLITRFINANTQTGIVEFYRQYTTVL